MRGELDGNAELKEMPENAKLMKLIRARLETLLAA